MKSVASWNAITLATLALTFPSAVPAEEPGFAAQANAFCRDVIDARDYRTFEAAKTEALDVLAAQIRGGEPPNAASAERLIDLFEAVNADIAEALDGISALAPDQGEQADALATVTKYAQAEMEVRRIRLGFLGDLDNWQWPPIDGLGITYPDSDAYVADRDTLGFRNRDCQHVFSSLGNPPDHASFISAVAPICSSIVDRRLTNGFHQWRDVSFNAFMAATQGRPVDPEAIPALRALAQDWISAADALAEIDAALAPDPRLWEQALTDMTQRAKTLYWQADIIEIGDVSAILGSSRWPPGSPQFEDLALGETSCVALREHF